MRRNIKDWYSWFAPVLACAALGAGLITRIVLLFNPLTVVDFTAWQWIKIFGLGALNDLAFAFIALVPAFLIYTTANKWKYSKLGGWAVWGVLLALTLYFLCFNDISDEYGGPVPVMVNSLLSVLFVCFSVKWFVPKVREGWRFWGLHVTTFVYAFLIMSNNQGILNNLCKVLNHSENGCFLKSCSFCYFVYNLCLSHSFYSL